MVAMHRISHVEAGSGVLHGAVGGAVAGMAMAMVEMLWSAAAGMGFWLPLRMIASVPLGTMPPEISLGTAIPVGMITHMMLSMMFGIAVVGLLRFVPALRSSALVTIVVASLFGLMLWLVNFYAVAPAIGRDWFTDADKVQQFVAHTFAFGTVLGLYLVTMLDRSEGRLR
ncbi:MAG: hypothetical protein EPO16_07555 [Dehalococcoidia bacterium]|nr:MAG: hypothetical protein EPO16_07555 [Dehalococcoidia bacterium]